MNEDKNEDKYVGAPYNFVSIEKEAYAPISENEMMVHDKIDDKLLSGEIRYAIKAETPIFIGQGNEKFFCNEKGDPVIPGSTIRGLIRNNVQILSASAFDKDIDDRKLMYRHVANGSLQGKYNELLGSKNRIIDGYRATVLENVRAGYIKKENGRYLIQETTECDSKVSNYYVLSERKIIEEIIDNPNNGNYPFFLGQGVTKLQHKKEHFSRFIDKKGRIHYKGISNPYYIPYTSVCSYKTDGQGNVIAVDFPEKAGRNGLERGYVLSSGAMNEKKAFYIIPEQSEKEPFEIPKEDVKSFEIDFESKKNTLKSYFHVKNKDKYDFYRSCADSEESMAERFFGLPKEGESKPVFYIKLNGKLYFGFTPRLRLFFDHSIKKEGPLQKKRDESKFDMSESIFGLADEIHSFRSKVSFGDARGENCKTGSKVSITLAEPKPTSYLDYLKNGKNYNDKDFEIRGVKQYWLRDDVLPDTNASANDTIRDAFFPLEKGTIFSGVIRFDNLTEKELGLLLWALKLEEGSQMNVGKAKPYGYGRISLSTLEMNLIDKAEAYDLSKGSISICSCKKESTERIDKFIDSYKKTAVENNGSSKAITELNSVNEFFAMKDFEKMPKPEKIRYMSIQNKEYQSRKKPLQTVKELVGGNTEEYLKEKSNVLKVAITNPGPDSKEIGKYVARTAEGYIIKDIPSDAKEGDVLKVMEIKNGRKPLYKYVGK